MAATEEEIQQDPEETQDNTQEKWVSAKNLARFGRGFVYEIEQELDRLGLSPKTNGQGFSQGGYQMQKSIYVDDVNCVGDASAIPLSRYGLDADDVAMVERGLLGLHVMVDIAAAKENFIPIGWNWLQEIFGGVDEELAKERFDGLVGVLTESDYFSFTTNYAEIYKIKPVATNYKAALTALSGLDDNRETMAAALPILSIWAGAKTEGEVPRYALWCPMTIHGGDIIRWFYLTDSYVFPIGLTLSFWDITTYAAGNGTSGMYEKMVADIGSALQNGVYTDEFAQYHGFESVEQMAAALEEMLNNGGGTGGDEPSVSEYYQQGYEVGYNAAENNEPYSEPWDQQDLSDEDFAEYKSGYSDGYYAFANSEPSDEVKQQWYEEGYSHGVTGDRSYGGMSYNDYYSKLIAEWERGAEVGYAEFEEYMNEQMQEYARNEALQVAYFSGENAGSNDTEYGATSNPYTNDEELASNWNSGYSDGWMQNPNNPDNQEP